MEKRTDATPELGELVQQTNRFFGLREVHLDRA
jgi:hypothetical protein